MTAKLNEIPYFTSPPIMMTLRQAITVNIAGNYVWPINRANFSPLVELNAEAIYFLRTVTFASDVSAEDYAGALVNLPNFSLYLRSEGGNPRFRQAIPLPLHFSNATFEQPFLTGAGQSGGSDRGQTASDAFLGSFTGSLIQTPNLVGKQAVTLTMQLMFQEVGDPAYISAFRKKYAGREK